MGKPCNFNDQSGAISPIRLRAPHSRPGPDPSPARLNRVFPVAAAATSAAEARASREGRREEAAQEARRP